jgi:putative two-component system response regulator
VLYARKIVIIVDDDPIILKLARNSLMNKYDVFTVPGPIKLFNLLERTTPDLILLDVLMPEMSGYDLIKILKKNDRFIDVPVIFLTSKFDIASEVEGLTLGAADYLHKPFSPMLLLKRVEVQMQMMEQRRELRILNDNLQGMVEQKAGSILRLQNIVLQTISNLVECRDDVTGGHVERTERILRFLVQEMLAQDVYKDQLHSWNLDVFFQSSQLHDVGKIAIPDAILLKPEKLSSEEFETMKQHTLFGEKVIEQIQHGAAEESMFLTHARIMAGTHHEKWNGTGYPRGLAGAAIPLQGQVMALADVYDALVSERPYKKAFTHEEAVRIIGEGSGNMFNPDLVCLFISAADRFAPSSIACLHVIRPQNSREA